MTSDTLLYRLDRREKASNFDFLLLLPNLFLTMIEKHQSWFSYFNIKSTRPFKAKRLTGFKFPSLSCTSRTKYSHEFLPFHPMRIELCAYLFTFWNTTEHGEAILLLCRTDFAELSDDFSGPLYTPFCTAHAIEKPCTLCHWKTDEPSLQDWCGAWNVR